MTEMMFHTPDSLCCAALCTGAGGPGACVAVLQGNDIIFEKSYGLADIQSGAAISPDTYFCLASVSKQFTSCAVLQLCEQGKISLEDEISGYFPEYTSAAWKGVKIKHLLSHSSGIPDRPPYLSLQQKIYADENLSIEYFGNPGESRFTPGSAYDYKNATYVLLGRLIEKISGEEFTQYMRKHILLPSGMTGATYFDRECQEKIPSRATGYCRGRDGNWEKSEYGQSSFFATKPDGGLYCSVNEFIKWEMALRKCLADRPDAILKSQTLKSAMTAEVPVSGSPYCEYENYPGTSYGYGWFIRTVEGGGRVIYHPGDNGGFTIMAARYPESDRLILIFANFPDWDRNGLVRALEDALEN